jgi:aryl-alcohol dehydrogenase-like predicted oxidoreductase
MENNKLQIKRLILGTAQLGMPYGIANKTGRPDEKTALKIIEAAWNAGVNSFDTAQGYGDSESVLGRAFSDLNISNDVHVISKFSHQIDHLNERVMKEELEKSLEKLNIPFFWGMMLHSEDLLAKWSEGLGEIFQKFVQSQKIRKVGFSVYSPEKALEALEQDGIDFIQIPGNVLDRRFEKAGVFELAEIKNKQIHIRSIFLQGLLLMDIEEIPGKMKYVIPVIEKLLKLSRQFGMTRKEVAMGYIKNAFPDSHVLFGVDSVDHVKGNIESWSKRYPDDLILQVKTLFDDVPENIINCNMWKQTR